MIHVKESWDKVEGFTDPKSKAGKRTLQIPEQLYEILEEHLVKIGRTEGLIFGQSATQPFSYNAVRERAERAWRKIGLDQPPLPVTGRPTSSLQLHECRHSYKSYLEATEIRDSRIDRYVGHADHSVLATATNLTRPT